MISPFPSYLTSFVTVLASIWLPFVGGGPAPRVTPLPHITLVQLEILQVEHSAIASNDQAGALTVTVAGRGAVDVVRSELSGATVITTVILSADGQILTSSGAGAASPTGATVNSNGTLLAWAGYNIRYLPCTSGLPTMRLAQGNGYTFTVTNPSPESMWVTFTYDDGVTYQPWAEIAAGTSRAFAGQPPAARAYVSHYSSLGPNLVCGNAGWKPM